MAMMAITTSSSISVKAVSRTGRQLHSRISEAEIPMGLMICGVGLEVDSAVFMVNISQANANGQFSG
jgi:hypothetical protein